MKKWTTLILALLLATTVFSAIPASADDAAPEQIELIYWIGQNPDQKDAELVWSKIDEITLRDLNCTVDWQVVSAGEYQQKWTKALAANERIDLCWVGYTMNIQDEVNNGALLPLDDLLAQYAPALLDTISPELLDAHRSADGKLYQFPAWEGLLGFRSWIGFPQELVDDMGEGWLQGLQDLFYEVWDVEERKFEVYDYIEGYLAAAKENGKLSYGYPTGQELNSWYLGRSIYTLGTYTYVRYYDDTFTVKPYCESTEFTQMAKYMADWYKKGYIREDIASVESIDVSVGWLDTNTERYIVKGHDLTTDNSLDRELSGTLFPWCAVYTNPEPLSRLGTATGTGIPFTSAYPERAMTLIDYLASEKGAEAYNLFVYGIEGKHYEWNEAHDHITLFGGAGQAASNWDYGQRAWYLGSLINIYSSDNWPGYLYPALKEAEKTAYTLPLLAFSFDNSNVEVEQASIKAVNDEYFGMFGKGYLADGWEAKYEEYVAKMYAAGLQNYVDEIQSQINAFVETRGVAW